MRAWMAMLIGLSILLAGAAAAIACLEAATALGAFGSALGSESRHSLPPPNTLFIVEPGSKSDACSYGTTACASASAAHTECPTGSVEVSIGDFFFEPQFSYLPAKGTVCWRNDGQVAHTVTSDEGIWLSGPIAPGTVYTITWRPRNRSPRNRTYHYHCDFHPAMRGAILVANHPPPPPLRTKETAGQENARRSAESYLETQAFSRKGLVKQLSSHYAEGFSKADAIYAVDHINVDWNEQVARAANSYLETRALSRKGPH